MTDTIKFSGVRSYPKYLVFEHGSAWGRDGATYLPGYEPQHAPAEVPAGWVSRYEVPTAMAMPKNRAAGVALCDRLEAMLPKLTDEQAVRLAARLKRGDDNLYAQQEHKTSLIRSGWRFGDLYRAERDVRLALGVSVPRRGR